ERARRLLAVFVGPRADGLHAALLERGVELVASHRDTAAQPAWEGGRAFGPRTPVHDLALQAVLELAVARVGAVAARPGSGVRLRRVRGIGGPPCGVAAGEAEECQAEREPSDHREPPREERFSGLKTMRVVEAHRTIVATGSTTATPVAAVRKNG